MDGITFLSLVKNMVHNFMMPPKGKPSITLPRAGEEGVSPLGWGGGGGYSDTFRYT